MNDKNRKAEMASCSCDEVASKHTWADHEKKEKGADKKELGAKASHAQGTKERK